MFRVRHFEAQSIPALDWGEFGRIGKPLIPESPKNFDGPGIFAPRSRKLRGCSQDGSNADQWEVKAAQLPGREARPVPGGWVLPTGEEPDLARGSAYLEAP